MNNKQLKDIKEEYYKQLKIIDSLLEQITKIEKDKKELLQKREAYLKKIKEIDKKLIG